MTSAQVLSRARAAGLQFRLAGGRLLVRGRREMLGAEVRQALEQLAPALAALSVAKWTAIFFAWPGADRSLWWARYGRACAAGMPRRQARGLAFLHVAEDRLARGLKVGSEAPDGEALRLPEGVEKLYFGESRPTPARSSEGRCLRAAIVERMLADRWGPADLRKVASLWGRSADVVAQEALAALRQVAALARERDQAAALGMPFEEFFAALDAGETFEALAARQPSPPSLVPDSAVAVAQVLGATVLVVRPVRSTAKGPGL